MAPLVVWEMRLETLDNECRVEQTRQLPLWSRCGGFPDAWSRSNRWKYGKEKSKEEWLEMKGQC